jgi:DNA-binding transcriptional MerR regulator
MTKYPLARRGTPIKNLRARHSETSATSSLKSPLEAAMSDERLEEIAQQFDEMVPSEFPREAGRQLVAEIRRLRTELAGSTAKDSGLGEMQSFSLSGY